MAWATIHYPLVGCGVGVQSRGGPGGGGDSDGAVFGARRDGTESQDLVRRQRDARRRERYILGPGNSAAARLENIARFLDFVSDEHHPRGRTGP